MKVFNGQINGVQYSDPVAFAHAISMLDPSESNEISAETLEQDTDICWYPGQDNSTSPMIEIDPESLVEDIADHYELSDFYQDDIVDRYLQCLSDSEKETYKTNLKKLLEVLNTKVADCNENIEDLDKKQVRLQEELDELENILTEESTRADNLGEAIDGINYVLESLEPEDNED